MPIRALSPELAEIARTQLNEEPARVAGDIQHLKEWIAKQPHLHARTDDQWLLAFLRGCKFSLERTKAKIDLYYTLRTTASELTTALKPTDPKFADILDLLPVVLPKTAGPGQPRISIMRPGDQDLSRFDICDVMCVNYLMQQVLLFEDDVLTVAGVRSVLDLEGATMAHFTTMTPTIMKKMVALGQDAAPIRMKGFHYLNTPPGFETLMNVMKTFLNEKNKSRIQVHNKNYEELYKTIPKEILPAEYGGSAGTIDEIRGEWKKKMMEWAAWLQEDLQYGTNESKRLGAPRTAQDMFGVDGSFRQLQLD